MLETWNFINLGMYYLTDKLIIYQFKKMLVLFNEYKFNYIETEIIVYH